MILSLIGNSQTILFEENFEGSSADWWKQMDGYSVINEDGNSLLKVSSGQGLFGGHTWDNYRLTIHAKLDVTDNSGFSLLTRSSAAGNYTLGLDANAIGLTRINYPGGMHKGLFVKDYHIGYNIWHIFKIEMNGDNIKLYIDNELVFNIIDNEPLLSGELGISTPTTAYFDNISVETDRLIPKQDFPWISTGGPIGGMGYDIRIHPVNHNIMFTTDVWKGVFKSYDGGKTWHARNKGIDFRNIPTNEIRFGPSGDAIPIFSLTIDPVNPDIVWCGTLGFLGIYKSMDCGESWSKMTNGISITPLGITFRGFAIDPTNSNKVFAATQIITGTNDAPGAIYRTTDGGQYWLKVLDSQSLVRIILIDPRNPKIVFASTGIFDANSVKEEGIWKSTDGGDTWFHTNNGINSKALTVEGLDFSVQNPDIMYASTGRGPYHPGQDEGAIYRSNDGGNTWNTVLKKPDGEYFVPMYLAISPSNSDIVYVGHNGGPDFSILRTMDGGKTWKNFKLWTSGVQFRVTISVAVHPHQPNIVYLNFYGGGVIKSTDYGETWNISSHGYTGAQIFDLSIDAENPSLLYCTDREGAFKSTNGGKDWIGLSYVVASGMATGAIEINPKNSRTVIAGYNGNNTLFKTTDGGYNWHTVFYVPNNPHSNASGATSISWSKSDTNVVFASYHLQLPNPALSGDSSTIGIYKSVDAGNSWFAINSGFEGTKKNALTVEVHPKKSNIVFSSLTGEGIYRSNDGGLNWDKKNNGIINLNIRSFAFDPVDENTIYAGVENGGIFKSFDLGESWTQITRGMDQEASISSIVINPQNHLDIFAHDWFSGIYRSVDGGKQWDLFNNGITTRAGKSLAISNDGKLLYAGTEGGGVFRLTLADFKTKIYSIIPDTLEVIRIKKGDSLEFLVDAYDYNTDSLKYSWLLNSVTLKNHDTEKFTFQSDSLKVGNYLLQTNISDKADTVAVKWKVEIYDCRKIETIENISICFGNNYQGWTDSGQYSRTLQSKDGCDSTITTNLIVNPLPAVAGAVTGAASVCQGQNSIPYSVPVISNASSYVWTLPTGTTGTSVTNSISVDYGAATSGNITIKGHNECGDGGSATLAITVNPKPATPVVTQNGNILRSSASNGNQWYNNNSQISGATNQDYTFNNFGDYSVVVTINGCSSDTSTTSIITGFDQLDFSKKITVYPNPVTEDLTIEYSGNFEEIKFKIVNLSGQILFEGKLSDKIIVHTSAFAPGLYFIKFDVGKSYEFRKVIKNQN